MMHCRPPFVYMYVYMYIRPSQPETPRLCNSLVFSAGAHDNKTLHLAIIGYKSAQHSTSLLHAAFRLLLTSLIAPVRATRLLAIPPYWLTSFGTDTLFPQVKHKTCTVLAKQGLASLHHSKYVGVDGSAAIQCFAWLAIPSFCQPVKVDCSSIIAQNVLALVELRSCTVLH